MENINWSKVRVQLCMPGYRYFDTTETEHYEKTLWNTSVVLINQSLLNLQRLFSLTFSTQIDRQVWLNQRNMFKKNPFFAIWHFMGRFGCFMHEEGSLSRKLGTLLNLHKAAFSLRELRGQLWTGFELSLVQKLCGGSKLGKSVDYEKTVFKLLNRQGLKWFVEN